MKKLLSISILLAAAGISALPVRQALAPPLDRLPSFRKVRDAYRKSDALLLDRHHRVIQEVRVDSNGRRLEWVPLGDISPAMQGAMLFAEDRRFYRHRGVDWLAVGGALTDAISGRKPRGASTITMQVASLINRELRARSSGRSMRQKWRQIQEARAIERRWTKAEILEAYFNLASFRGELQGIGAASRGLFGKEPHGLNDSESVILASLMRAPNAAPAEVARRAAALGAALRLNLERDIASQAKEVLSRPYFIEPQAGLAPRVAQLLSQAGPASGGGPSQILSTLDGRLQAFAQEILRRHLLDVTAQNVHDGALLAVENKTGEVVAYVANSGASASARYVDGVQALRQAGSILKPFLYGLAFEKRFLTPASLIEDGPLDIPVFGGIYRPRNYDEQFNGLVTARVALASSLNVPAVRTLAVVGVEAFLERLDELGLKNLQSADFYGPSLALGSADVRLWDLVGAYRTLAAGGMRTELRLAPNNGTATPQRRVYTPEAVFLVSSILSDRESRSKTFSLESPLSTRFWTAVKTGTSKDMRDNWCIGYSSEYTVGVWTGNFSGEPMWDVSGITGAAPVWLEIMSWLHRGTPSVPPAPPAGIIAKTVQLPELAETRREWFLKGTEPAEMGLALAPAASRIVYPVTGTVIALDPDIPQEEQRMFFESQPHDERLRWKLNGERIGPAESIQLWSPHPGKYTLTLVDEDEQILDSVNFEVRGTAAYPNFVTEPRAPASGALTY